MILARRLLAAPDKFRGTATAREVASAIADAAVAAGWTCEQVPVSDGGEGMLDCFGGANRNTTVGGPLTEPVVAPWRLDGRLAVIEMAAASGLALVTGRNNPITATTAGTGQLIAAALDEGARRVIVGAGGSATTDGGLGAVDTLTRYAPLDGTRGYRVEVATDVSTTFLQAAELFGPQKGADDDQVHALSGRLLRLAEFYRESYGIDVAGLLGSGAAGGLAGGLAALGARITPGFTAVADELGLADRIAAADLVVTGEGRLDATSALGKAPWGVLRMCRDRGVPVAVVAGSIDPAVSESVRGISLLDRYGRAAAMRYTLECIRAAVTELISEMTP